jgi:hypothetical protein
MVDSGVGASLAGDKTLQTLPTLFDYPTTGGFPHDAYKLPFKR